MHFSNVSDRKSPILKGEEGGKEKFVPCDGSSLTCQGRTGLHIKKYETCAC